MSATYKHPAMKQLTEQQARFAPIDKRLEQMSRAEKLLTQIEAGQSYNYQELTEVLTGYRSEKYPDLSIEGEDLLHDLPKFIEELSASTKLPVEAAGEPVFTVNELSEKYNVSTKTIDRWRKRGLVSRKFLFGNRARVGFLLSLIHI